MKCFAFGLYPFKDISIGSLIGSLVCLYEVFVCLDSYLGLLDKEVSDFLFAVGMDRVQAEEVAEDGISGHIHKASGMEFLEFMAVFAFDKCDYVLELIS